jgi:glycosyltransferase involved in cell wall biosynthesis
MSAAPHPAKRRLLVVTSMFPRWRDDSEPGFVFELCRRLTDRFEVRVLAPRAPGAATAEVMDGVEVVRYRYAPRRSETLAYGGGIVPKLRRQPWRWLQVPFLLLGQYLAIRRQLADWHPDAVHAHWIVPQGVLSALAIGKKYRTALVITSHGTDMFAFNGAFMRKIKRWALNKSASVTVVGGAMRDTAIALGVGAAKVRVAPMGVDLRGRFVSDPHAERSRDEILFVGRLAPSKGLDVLLEAVPEILVSHPQATITLAGFGPAESALRSQARRLGIADRVTFAGPMPQHALPDLYRRAAVFVAPFVRTAGGEQEGFGLVIVEAIGCGCPVVATDMPGSRDILGDGADLIEPGNAKGLAQGILKVLDAPDTAVSECRALRERIFSNRDWKTVAAGYSAMIADCIDESEGLRS